MTRGNSTALDGQSRVVTTEVENSELLTEIMVQQPSGTGCDMVLMESS